ncbi:MAG: hypothetical protein GY934_21315 [Gammaproteobacteria bacterium]|nr:hypothetical protein [Gammaproteobacteria bacterium]
MPTTKTIQIRSTRDRLIDLLGFGETYPLRDLPVQERLKVLHDTAAKIPIDHSQKDVNYYLYDKQGNVQKRPAEAGGDIVVEAAGTGGTIQLETAQIKEPETFLIKARKSEIEREAYLYQDPSVEVGLDLSLDASISNGDLLDPHIENPASSEPRIIDYEESLQVKIPNSQEGVNYRLVHFPNGEPENSEPVELFDQDVRGDLSEITLHSIPLQEDTVIQIRATKHFRHVGGRDTDIGLLEIKLPLKVRANPRLKVSVQPLPIIDYQQAATILISNTQSSVRYQLYIHKIPDREFLHNPAPDSKVIRVHLPGEPEVQVNRPPFTAHWVQPEGYKQEGEFISGNGADLQLPLKPLADNTLVIIQAHKEHQVSESKTIPYSVQLEQPALLLVRPNPTPELELKTVMESGRTNGKLWVTGGQPGVFYYFRKTENGKNFKWPAYFHKQDETDDSFNKGLGQIAIGIDFSVAADPTLNTTIETNDLSKIAPVTPTLKTIRLPAGTQLFGRAKKAQTQITVALEKTAKIPALPEIQVVTPEVDANKKAKIRVVKSHEGDRYQLTLNGQPVKRARKGNGQDIDILTGPITEENTFEMWVTHPDETNILMRRVVLLPVKVR